MGIGANHPEYNAALPRWTRVRDVLAGEDTIKAKGEAYLPKLEGMNAKDFDFYVANAYFFEGSSRAAEAFVGMLMRKDPAVQLPETASSWRDDIAGTGISLDELLVSSVVDVVQTGRCGALVDWPGSTEGLTLAEAERSGSAPLIKLYPAEAIVNWAESNGKLLWVVVEEAAAKEDGDRYAHETVRQRRELFLDGAAYRQRIFRLVDDDSKEEKWVQFGEDITPTKSGSPLSSIPWVWLGAQENTASVNAAPLRQIVNCALAMYRNSAAFEKALIYGGNPQVWASLGGWRAVTAGGEEDAQKRTYSIGGSEVWEFPENSQVGVVNFATGAEMPLERAISAKKADMAVLGARLLEGQKKGAEAAETEEIRRSGENSAIGRIADNLTLAWTRVLKLVAEWAGWAGDVGVTFSKDFLSRPVTAQEVTAAMDLYLRGAWALPDLHGFLIAGEWQPETRTTDAIEADLEAARPSAAPVGGTRPVGVPALPVVGGA